MMTYRDAVAVAMHDILESNINNVVIGQSVSDDVGILGTTLGLTESHPNQVFETPIMEEGVAGICLGMAINGVYPINTHIRVDFLLVAMNQIVNLIAKYRYTYGGSFKVPMLIRAIIGRSWGQGPQHSQSLQSIFAHIPGLTVIMPSSAQSVYSSYVNLAAEYKNPVLSFEHRFLYDYSFESFDKTACLDSLRANIVRSGKDFTIVACSYMVEESLLAAGYLSEQCGVECEIIDLHCISHMDKDLILQSVKKTGAVVIADTGWTRLGVASEICKIILEHDQDMLKVAPISLGMADSPCPTSHALENEFYCDMSDVVNSISKALRLSNRLTKEYAKSIRNSFKGPF
jgi:acetoin:2,6-dichlorophenolindophenol oxidoreductase subunit beta